MGSAFDFYLDTTVRYYKLNMTDADRFKRRLLKNEIKLLLAVFKSMEAMVSLVKRAFKIVPRQKKGKEADQLE